MYKKPLYRYYDQFNGVMTYSRDMKLSRFFMNLEMDTDGENPCVLMPGVVVPDTGLEIYAGDIFGDVEIKQSLDGGLYAFARSQNPDIIPLLALKKENRSGNVWEKGKGKEND